MPGFLFIQEIFFEHLLCARHFSNQGTRQGIKQRPLSHEGYILVSETKNRQINLYQLLIKCYESKSSGLSRREGDGTDAKMGASLCNSERISISFLLLL